jgi:hypothetical protein
VPATTIEPLPRKTRVKVTIALDGVPEGTAGTVRGTVGLTLPRHRVEFDNGHFVTSVARPNLVLEDEWDDFVAERERAAEAEAQEAAAPAAAPEAVAAGDGDDAGPADDRLAALLAKSKAAREKKGTGA